MWIYSIAVFVLWTISPELRRVLDWRLGHSEYSIIQMLTLLSVLPHFVALSIGGTRRLSRPLALAAWIWIGAFTFGLLLSLIDFDNFFAAVYSFAIFVLPIGPGLWIASDSLAPQRAADRVLRTIFVMTTVIAVYGIIQYVTVPPWDAAWLSYTNDHSPYHMTSFGLPQPFKIRVFSMLASPGPCGNFIALALILALPALARRNVALLLALPLWLATFALSMDRTGWIMFGVGLIIYLVAAPRRLALLFPLVTTVVLALGFASAVSLSPQGERALQSVSDRFATFTDISRDRSAADRTQLYADSLNDFRAAPFGRGLGSIGLATKLQGSGVNPIDSGIFERLIDLGLLGTTMYAAALFVSIVALSLAALNAGRMRIDSTQDIAVVALAIQVALLVNELFGESHSLLPGVIMWTTTALALQAADRLRPAPHLAVAPAIPAIAAP